MCTFIQLILSIALIGCGLLKDSSVELEFHPGIAGRHNLFVSQALGNDANDGAQLRPLKTITAAMEKGRTLPAPFYVRIATGTYSEPLALEQVRVSFIGGYNDTFELHSDTTYPTLIRGQVQSIRSQVSLDFLRFHPTLSEEETGVIGGLESTLIINNSQITWTPTTINTFGVYSDSGSLTILNSTITLPQGSANSSGVVSVSGQLTMKNTDITGSNLTGIDIRGVLANGDATLEGNRIELTGSSPGGVLCYKEDETPIEVHLERNRIKIESGYGFYINGIEAHATLANNLIVNTGGINAVVIQKRGSYIFRNNTLIHSGLGALFVHAGSEPNGNLTIENNLFSAPQVACIAENYTGNFGGIRRIRNNSFQCSTDLYSRDPLCAGSKVCTVAQMEALSNLNASGNFSASPVFVDTATNNYQLAEACPTQIKEGGLNGESEGWDFLNDYLGQKRIGQWSVGAFQYQ